MKKSIEYMLVKYDEYWEAIKDTALICQIIDPRYKNFNLDSTMKTKVYLFKFVSASKPS